MGRAMGVEALVGGGVVLLWRDVRHISQNNWSSVLENVQRRQHHIQGFPVTRECGDDGEKGLTSLGPFQGSSFSFSVGDYQVNITVQIVRHIAVFIIFRVIWTHSERYDNFNHKMNFLIFSGVIWHVPLDKIVHQTNNDKD